MRPSFMSFYKKFRLRKEYGGIPLRFLRHNKSWIGIDYQTLSGSRLKIMVN